MMKKQKTNKSKRKYRVSISIFCFLFIVLFLYSPFFTPESLIGIFDRNQSQKLEQPELTQAEAGYTSVLHNANQSAGKQNLLAYLDNPISMKQSQDKKIFFDALLSKDSQKESLKLENIMQKMERQIDDSIGIKHLENYFYLTKKSLQQFHMEWSLIHGTKRIGPVVKRTVYFTIDDGPSHLTKEFLRIFDKYRIRATFFLVGRNVDKLPEVTKEIYDRGHLIANHSYSHDYKKLYRNKTELLNELKQWDEAVSKALGFPFHTNIFRFPGGSTYSKARKYHNFVMDQGYDFYDWNCVNGDAQLKDKSADNLYNYMVQTYRNQDEVVLLIHDTDAKQTTVDMLERAIIFFRTRFYEFKTIDEKVL